MGVLPLPVETYGWGLFCFWGFLSCQGKENPDADTGGKEKAGILLPALDCGIWCLQAVFAAVETDGCCKEPAAGYPGVFGLSLFGVAEAISCRIRREGKGGSREA